MIKKFISLIIIICMFAAALPAFSEQSEYTLRFLEMWEELHDPANGYFSPEGAPYHSIETLMVEAPDHGHETTSEAYSYWIWLEAMYGKVTGDWSYLQNAWKIMEEQIIPTKELQPSNSEYNPEKPATYAPEFPLPSFYPARLETSIPVGSDPIAKELETTYGTADIYGMHWLLDCDNFYGYGNKGDGVSKPSYINTFQRGEQESTWETIPHPSWEEFKWGGQNGFLDLFTGDQTYSKQYRYTNAPDADARVVQAMYWAYQWVKEQGLDPNQVLPISKASKMGDYLRYSMFDKYFKKIGCQDVNSPGATGYDSAHYLMSWYYAWGGSVGAQYGWSWRIGSSHNHFGYQNPVAAYVLSNEADFIPASPNAEGDWAKSYKRQVELYRWLQSSNGAIAGGATNSWGGQYQAYPAGKATFYGMAYEDNPVYKDPGSNTWFGMQAWSMERMCELYYMIDDPMVNEVVEKWITWVKTEVKLENGTYKIPVKLRWEGQPDTWNPANPGSNSGLKVFVDEYNQDVGIAGCLAKALIYYAAGTREKGTLDTEAQYLAKEILDRMWDNYRDDKGVSVTESRNDFKRFFEQEVYVPAGWTGQMANGDQIKSGVKFIDIRSGYKNDPEWARLEAAYAAGEDYTQNYHRFWGQADVALALAEYANFFDGGIVIAKPPVIEITAPKNRDQFLNGDVLTINAAASDEDGEIVLVEFFVDGEKVDEPAIGEGPYSVVIDDILVDGPTKFTLTAKATDNDGLTAVSKAVIITFYKDEIPEGNAYVDRFLEMWEELHDPANGYFSPEGAPYHSIETLMVEAPDHGHETTSEAYSYWIWLEAMYGRVTGDWSYLQNAWKIMEEQIIPTNELQPSNSEYNPEKPATYAPEFPLPSFYPAQLETSIPVGSDPIAKELETTYGTADIYGMHWLLDCDNFYGYGNKGDGVSKPSYINTFQRGEQESTWETIPHPSWEEFKWGGENGFLDLFTGDQTYSKQYRYTNAPDADARVVQAMYWAYQWVKEQGLDPNQVLPISEASKMGDYLRYSMFDKYFKKIGCQDVNSPGATGYDSAHYLMSWYYAWGGSVGAEYGWSWRIGSSHNHFGYQNPVAAYVLSNEADFIPASPNAEGDWAKSYKRQVELYRWLQSSNGAIAGGATNSWGGQYQAYPAGKATFYGMAYEDNPVYKDPGSNTWFGMQAWSMERMCELYYMIDDPMVNEVVEKWIAWVKTEVKLENGTYKIPVKLRWEGQPDTWNPANPGSNSGLKVFVDEYNQDVGIAGCLAKALTYYAAGSQKRGALDTEAQYLAKEILDRMWDNYRDDKGVSVTESRNDFKRFFEQEVYVPAGWTGQMANGDEIKSGVKFIDIRSGYKNDPEWARLEEAYSNGLDYTQNYHRFWGQADVALALAEYGYFFDNPVIPRTKPVVSLTSPVEGSKYQNGDVISIKADAMDADGEVVLVEFFMNGVKMGEDAAAPYGLNVNVTDLAVTGKTSFEIIARATDNEGQVGSSMPVSIIVYPQMVEGDIELLYKCGNTDSTTNQLKPQISLKNVGTSTINLADLTARYYFTKESDTALEFHCDYAVIGSGNVSGTYSHIADKKYYLEVSFGSGTLQPGQETGEIQLRINHSSWQNLEQDNDYSFDASKTGFTRWENMTVYKEGVLIWGIPDDEQQSELPPVVSVSSPANGASIEIGTGIVIEAAATDADGSVVDVKFYNGSNLLSTDTTAPYSSIEWVPMVAGTFTLKAVATDNDGQTAEKSVTITVTDGTVTPPTVSITSPANGAVFTKGDNITITANAGDADGSVTSVAFYNNGSLIGTDLSAPYSVTISNAPAGTYSITAVATDNDGEKTTSTAVTFEVEDDITPPTGVEASFTVDKWSNGFVANITLTNTGTTTANNWVLTFDLPAGASITSNWSCNATQSGRTVTVTGYDWNKNINPAGSIGFGMQGTHSGNFGQITNVVVTSN